MSTHGWSTPPLEVMEKYMEKCKLFVENDEAFSHFKRDPDYTKILEGNEKEVLTIALQGIDARSGRDVLMGNLPSFKENESIGDPLLLPFEDTEIAPSTVRYVNTVLEIKEFLGDFIPKKIVEVGGGYGGLCKTMSVLYDFDSYTITDLPEATALTEKYLSHFPIKDKIQCIPCTEELEGTFDLFIADSSLAECDTETHLKYAELAKRCKYIYVVYNTAWLPGKQDDFRLFIRQLEHFKGTLISLLHVLVVRLKRQV